MFAGEKMPTGNGTGAWEVQLRGLWCSQHHWGEAEMEETTGRRLARHQRPKSFEFHKWICEGNLESGELGLKDSGKVCRKRAAVRMSLPPGPIFLR